MQSVGRPYRRFFWFEVPYNRRCLSESEARALASGILIGVPSPTTLLIVDDDPSLHELIRTMLDPAEWSIESAYTGDQAFDCLRDRSYQLVLSDILIGATDGLTLLPRIHEVRPESKVLVMTGQNASDHIIASIRAQACGYLTKPFSRGSLLETLRHALACDVEADDIEILSDSPHWISVQVRCKISTAERLAHFFRELPSALEPAQREEVSTAFRELLMNAIEHGGRFDPEQRVFLSYIHTGRSILYYIRDPGEGFSLDELPHAAISNNSGSPIDHAEFREKMGIRPGGFGILVTRNFADELLYSAKGNEVILIKYL